MKTKRERSPPTLSKEGKITIKVSKIILRLFCFLNNFRIRAILKARRTVAELKALALVII